jgi:hypothetical protein
VPLGGSLACPSQRGSAGVPTSRPLPQGAHASRPPQAPVGGQGPFFACFPTGVGTDVSDACWIAHPARMQGPIHPLALDGRRWPSVGRVQEECASRPALRAAAVSLRALTGLAMANTLRALTVGTGQQVDEHKTTPSP